MSKSLIEVIRHSEQQNELWQWDTGRQIIITPEKNAIVDEVHFSNAYSKDALVVKPQVNEQGNIVADIPNILLWQVFPINVYVVMEFPNGKGTIYEEQLKINSRKKPSDYVYTETEVRNYEALEERIKALEENGTGGGGGITKETDPTVPEWAKQPTKPSYTADEVGAASKDEFDKFVLKHEEEFDKLSEEIDELKSDLDKLNVVEFTDYQKDTNAYVKADGTISRNNEYFTGFNTSPFYVSDGDVIEFNGERNSPDLCVISTLNENGTLTPLDGIGVGANHFLYFVPNDVNNIVVSGSLNATFKVYRTIKTNYLNAKNGTEKDVQLVLNEGKIKASGELVPNNEYVTAYYSDKIGVEQGDKFLIYCSIGRDFSLISTFDEDSNSIKPLVNLIMEPQKILEYIVPYGVDNLIFSFYQGNYWVKKLPSDKTDNTLDIIKNEPLLLPNTVYTVEGGNLTLYRDSIQQRDLYNTNLPLYVSSGNTTSSFVYEKELNGVSDKLSLFIKYDDKFYGKQSNIVNVNKSNINGKNATVLVFGDSLTENGLPTAIKNKLMDYGIVPNMIGTKNDIYGTPAEGRGAWCLSNYVGISTKAGNGAYIGEQRPNFLKLATAEDKINYPDFCFTDTNSFTEKSYSQIVNEGGNVNQNFYIFDLENYLSINNFTKPNAVYITMGFNDFNYANNGINVYERLKTCFDIMITMINRLSNVSIAIDALPSIAFSHIGGLKRQKEWFFECMKYIENRNENNVKFVPRCISQPSMLMYNFDKTEVVENVYELSVVLDDIHPNYVGYEKGAEHFCNFVAYVVKN